MEKATLSVQELAAQLGISLPKAYELVKQPGFPVLKIGTRQTAGIPCPEDRNEDPDPGGRVQSLACQQRHP